MRQNMKSDVYFVEIKSEDIKTKLAGLEKLLHKTNVFAEYKKAEFIPIKLTIGDSQSIHHIDPLFVKLIISEIKKKKAKPFLFDTNVIYKGQRMNAVDHLTLAQNKGFGHSRVGAPFIIGDGLFGQDGYEATIGSENIKKIRTPSFIGYLDNLVVLSHITGHILSGYAGAIKNVAMGMCSRPTKQVQHSSIKPSVIKDKCTACGCCIEICPTKAISFEDKLASIDQNRCIGCGECLCVCKFDAISVNWDEDATVFSQRLADVSKFILSKFKNKFFINFAFEITKDCDCISTKSDSLISQNIGILASKDAVSVDKATVDLLNKHEDVFQKQNLNAIYKKLLEDAHNKGIGNLDYNLIKL